MRAYKVLVFKSRVDNFDDVSFPKDWKVTHANPRFFNPSLIENGLKAVVSNREDIRKAYQKYDIPTFYVEDNELVEDGVKREVKEKKPVDTSKNVEDTSVSFDLDSIIADKEAKQEDVSDEDSSEEDFSYKVDVDPSEEETDETYRLKNMDTPLRDDWKELGWLDARSTAKLYTEDTIRNKEHAFEVLQQVADEQSE